MKPEKATNLGRKAAIIAITGGAATLNSELASSYEESTRCAAAETFRLDELQDSQTLAKAYKEVAGCREIYGIIPTVRSRIFSVLRHVAFTSPGFIKSRVTNPEDVSIHDLEEMGVASKDFSPLVDLGAFDLQKLRAGTLNLSELKEHNINEIVLMEDRSPLFFLNYQGYDADAQVPLSRHSNIEDIWTMGDLKSLVDQLHQNGIKVVIGFWANAGNKYANPFVTANWEDLKPIIPISDDLNPLAFVTTNDGERIPFAEYIVRQYRRLDADFNLDGLFLGDGFMGYRAFFDVNGPYEFSTYSNLWTDFYRRVFSGVKETDSSDTLWAYDCLGKGRSGSLSHGVNVSAIADHLDYYVFQSYGNDAWGDSYMNLPDYDLNRDVSALASLPLEVKMKVKYTAGLRDNVEGWASTKDKIRAKQEALHENSKAGSLGVWSNDIFRKLL